MLIAIIWKEKFKKWFIILHGGRYTKMEYVVMFTPFSAVTIMLIVLFPIFKFCPTEVIPDCDTWPPIVKVATEDDVVGVTWINVWALETVTVYKYTDDWNIGERFPIESDKEDKLEIDARINFNYKQ